MFKFVAGVEFKEQSGRLGNFRFKGGALFGDHSAPTRPVLEGGLFDIAPPTAPLFLTAVLAATVILDIVPPTAPGELTAEVQIETAPPAQGAFEFYGEPFTFYGEQFTFFD